MKKPLKLKLSTEQSSSANDAEALFRDLKVRDPHIQHLWAHQADIIREYHKVQNQRDIALELPTGAGKTLVGLLIAEWRRQSLGERVAYLCPTRQLAHQVGTRASEYGIKARVLVGPQKDYPPGHFSDYASAEAIAVTTYSGLFNSNPRISDPETIVLDDAHAGESYIAGLWSVSISRRDHRSLYDQVLHLFEKDLPSHFVASVKDELASPVQRQGVDLLPGIKLMQRWQELTHLLDAFDDEPHPFYSWSLLRDKLRICCLYFSWGDILIRPWISPTLTHRPFADAKQRLYMSATLGAGGELERITGVPNIHRIPVPTGWDRQSTGRRLFIFPDRSFSEKEYRPWLSRLIATHGRSLVLTPYTAALSEFEKGVAAGLNLLILHSVDVEDSLDAFTKSPNAVLALTARYDGVDLPGEQCRVLLVYKLPAAVNLQERFLWSKLGLTTVLRDTVRTRITQAVGRCTRSSTDYAVVVMAGEDLFDFCVKRNNRAEFHPELRAEMDFGLDNSDTDAIEDLTDLADLLLQRQTDWDVAEADIAKRRDEAKIVTPSYVKTLRDVADVEVKYLYSLWKEDFEQALAKAADIADQLGGDELAGYRALWHYFAGDAAYLLGQATGRSEFQATASKRFQLAAQSVRTISWFSRLSNELSAQATSITSTPYAAIVAAEAIHGYLQRVGTVGKKFGKLMTEYSAEIESTDFKKFDHAVTELGRMLGFDAESPTGNATPDSVWRLADDLILLFECKADESPEGCISVATCRQAQGHSAWLQSQPDIASGCAVHTIVVTPRRKIDPDAMPHASGLFYLDIDQARRLFRETSAWLQVTRSKCADLDASEALAVIQVELENAKLTPSAIVARLTRAWLEELDRC